MTKKNDPKHLDESVAQAVVRHNRVVIDPARFVSLIERISKHPMPSLELAAQEVVKEWHGENEVAQAVVTRLVAMENCVFHEDLATTSAIVDDVHGPERYRGIPLPIQLAVASEPMICIGGVITFNHDLLLARALHNYWPVGGRA